MAFFIYGIFSPSWAARLRYNVRTFPSRVTSWISNQSFLDYDSYKLSMPSIWDKIELNIGDENSEDSEILDIDEKTEIDVNSEQENLDIKEEDINSKDKELETDVDEADKIKAFPKSINFIELPGIKGKSKSETDNILTWYSKSDLLRIINKYIEKNLDDDTDILVTVEYDDETKDPQKIILQTQPITHSSANLLSSIDINENMSSLDDNKSQWENENKIEKKSDTQTQKNSTQTKLSQKDIQDAQEVFSILF